MTRRVFFLLTLCLGLVAGCADAARQGPADRFGIYTARLSGAEARLVIASPWQQMTHPRVSPDGKWITFTRYHEAGLDGLALEKRGYKNTAIMLMRLDGSQMQTVIASRPGILNCNSSWSPDGKSLIWLSTENPARLPQLMRIELATRKITRIPTPAGLAVADPHVVGDRIVFPVVKKDAPNPLWIMNLDGSNARPLTRPDLPKGSPFAAHHPGDYDPKLSPDGREVAFMRLHRSEGWRVLVVDVASGRERDLSGPDRIDGLPDWSSDGKRLLFWHADRKNLKETGVYSMRPDGSERRMVPLPRGLLHGHPHFFPNDGSGPETRIIYQAIRAPQLP